MAKLFVVSGPAGVGKDTVLAGALRRIPNLVKSVSMTTRPRGAGEQNGAAYFFVDEPTFDHLRDGGELLEWARVHEHLYGTPRQWVIEQLSAGRNVILNIDVQGGLQIKQMFPEAVLVFIMPPGDPIATLRHRLQNRARDSREGIEVRLRNAKDEMACADRYDHCLTNDDADRAAAELARIVESA